MAKRTKRIGSRASILKGVCGLIVLGIVLVASRRLFTGGGKWRRINSYIVNGTKALDLVRSASRFLPTAWSVERTAMLAAQLEYNQRISISAQNTVLSNPKQRLLCATFTAPSAPTLDLLYSNMRQLGKECHWAVVFYKPPTLPQLGMVQAFRENITHTLPMVKLTYMEAAMDRAALVSKYTIPQPPLLRGGLFGRSADEIASALYNNAVYPKPLLFLHLLPLLMSYKRVWLLDDDVSLDGFDLPQFLDICDCAFWPVRPPLIVQPLLSPASQLYPFLGVGEGKWGAGWDAEDRASGTNTLAATTGFIELQAPLMDTAFLSWFLRFVVVPMVAPIHIMGADWGVDDLFCTAAANYDHASHGVRGTKSQSSNPVMPCAVIMGGSTMKHLDSGVLRESMGGGAKWYLNHEMLAMVTKTFPSVFHKGFLSSLASPLNSTGRSIHRRVRGGHGDLSRSCLSALQTMSAVPP